MSAVSLKSVGQVARLRSRDAVARDAVARDAVARDAVEDTEAPAPESGLGLVRVIGPGENGTWRVQRGGMVARDAQVAPPDEQAFLDPSVDPAFVRDCAANGSRVVVERARGLLTIVGALAVQRPVVIDRRGHVEVHAKQIALTGDERVLLRSAGAFVQLRVEDVELYGRRVVSRARELCRVLGRMVKIN